MKRRLMILFALALAAGAAPTVAAHASTTTSLPPACVVVHGPQGVTIQVGYAPDGPSTCHQLG